MTQNEFIALASRISFGGGLLFWAPTVTAEAMPDGGVRVLTTKIVLDRGVRRMPTDPAAAREGMGGMIGGDYCLTARQLARCTPHSARERMIFFVRDSMTHEVDEGIRFDGEIARDPHVSDEPTAGPPVEAVAQPPSDKEG